VILFIDEFDSLPAAVIDQLVSLFRDIYLMRRDSRDGCGHRIKNGQRKADLNFIIVILSC